MGAVNSCCIPRRTFDECRENHATTPRRLTRRNLSATFQWPSVEEEGEVGAGLLNINTATEEELMTLPGINRPAAQRIIEYRRQIGGFKKVEDLALVSGVGATRLTQMRNEICVSSKRVSGSHSSSPTGSKQDLSVQSRERRRPNGTLALRVNLNAANVFQLMRVKGLGHNLAENIVAYRDKKGPFRSVDDLVKVKGVSPSVLSAIRYQLTLAGETVSEVSPPGPASRPSSQYSFQGLSNGGIPSTTTAITTTTTASPTTPPMTPPINGFNSWHSVENILEFLGPVVSKCQRKSVKKFAFRNDERKAFRVASWNLTNFSVEKASNHGVQDVVCMSVLENGFGILAVQDLADQEALQMICDELNKPSLPHVRDWKGRKGIWKCSTSGNVSAACQGAEHHGFLYDASQNIELINDYLLEIPKSQHPSFARQPYVGVFKVNGDIDCVVISVHQKASESSNEGQDGTKLEEVEISAVAEAIADHVPGDREVIILGHFNCSPDAEAFSFLRDKGYHNCIQPWVFTDISSANRVGSKSLDNVWLSKHALKIYTDHASVVREGLSSPFIPNGWTLGGVVSDHCPVFAELFADRGQASEDISRGVDNIVFTVGAGS